MLGHSTIFSEMESCAKPLHIDLQAVTAVLPSPVRSLHGALVSPMRTSADGACSIHAVWGDWVEGSLFKRNARGFLSTTFGPTSTDFRKKLASSELLAELEIALWDLLSPIAKQSINEGADTHLRDKEAYYVWNILHH